MNEEEDNGEETRESEWSYYSHMHIATRELIRAKGFASWNPKSLLAMTGAHTNGLLVDPSMYFVPLWVSGSDCLCSNSGDCLFFGSAYQFNPYP